MQTPNTQAKWLYNARFSPSAYCAMQLADFDFHLPEHLIAQQPPERRGSSRLLDARPGRPLCDRLFAELPNLLEAGDLLVFNNTKHCALAHIRSSKSPKPGSLLEFDGGIRAQMEEREGELFKLRFSGSLNVYQILEQTGRLPLPPYIERAADAVDDERYQTIYAKHQGAVAAPTAGLHFTPELLAQLQANGIRRAEITLHVGAGTFQPVRSKNIAEHKMHKEWYSIPTETVEAIKEIKANGKRVWAVGTTSMRSLEAAAQNSHLQAGEGDTDIFITPGYRFQVADGLITNFHLPKSTLLMLVSAFSGVEHIRTAYRHAIEQQYRFFSYGDAMLLTRAEAT